MSDFVTRTEMEELIPVAAAPKLQFQCETCEKVYISKEGLKKHMKIHSGLKPYQCVFCNATFYRNEKLNDHYCRHIGEKPSFCEICGAEFFNSSDRGKHMRRHHGVNSQKGKKVGQEKPLTQADTKVGKHTKKERKKTDDGSMRHECEVCKKTYSRVDGLRVHMRTHTGERPYKCTVCQEGFIRKDNLLKHMKKRHAQVEPDVGADKKGVDPSYGEVVSMRKQDKAEVRPDVGTEKKCKERDVSFGGIGVNMWKQYKAEQGFDVANVLKERGKSPKEVTFEFEIRKQSMAKIDWEREARNASCGLIICKILKNYERYEEEVLPSSRRSAPDLPRVKPYKCHICGRGFSQTGNLERHIRRHTHGG